MVCCIGTLTTDKRCICKTIHLLLQIWYDSVISKGPFVIILLDNEVASETYRWSHAGNSGRSVPLRRYQLSRLSDYPLTVDVGAVYQTRPYCPGVKGFRIESGDERPGKVEALWDGNVAMTSIPFDHATPQLKPNQSDPDFQTFQAYLRLMIGTEI